MTEKLTEYQNKLLSETLCKMVLDGATPDKIKEATRLLTKQMVQLNASSFSENLCSATVAIEDGEAAAGNPPELPLQNGLDLLVEAALANIVEGLRHDWRSEWLSTGETLRAYAKLPLPGTVSTKEYFSFSEMDSRSFLSSSVFSSTSFCKESIAT